MVLTQKNAKCIALHVLCQANMRTMQPLVQTPTCSRMQAMLHGLQQAGCSSTAWAVQFWPQPLGASGSSCAGQAAPACLRDAQLLATARHPSPWLALPLQVFKNANEMYSEQDLYVGKVLPVHHRTFELLEADEFTYQVGGPVHLSLYCVPDLCKPKAGMLTLDGFPLNMLAACCSGTCCPRHAGGHTPGTPSTCAVLTAWRANPQSAGLC